MYEVDFSKPIHIHFIGIGGISMSGLAEILLKENFTISGSDAKESDLTRHLTSHRSDPPGQPGICRRQSCRYSDADPC